jgi:N utilization substance protein B
MTNQNPNMSQQRRKARKLALQALYQWHVAETPVHQIEAEFLTDNDMSKVDKEYFCDVLRGVPSRKAELDDHIKKYIDRELKDLTPVELAILRMGTFELVSRIDVPYKVIINEGVELSKAFGANEAHRFVNGILDKLAQELRIAEVKAK